MNVLPIFKKYVPEKKIIKDNLPILSEDGIRPNSVVGKAARASRCFWAANSESDIRWGEEIRGTGFEPGLF